MQKAELEIPTDQEISERSERGWLIPYLIGLDEMFSCRWDYWLKTVDRGEVLEEPIPQIKWLSSPAAEAMKNLDECVKMSYSRSGWESFNLFVEWLLYGFGSLHERPAGLEDSLNALWYRKFNLGLFLRDPYDYLGHYAADFYGGGSNRTAYFPTPMNVSIMMAEMLLSEDAKTKSVCDPCVGSGRLLMVASNYSLNLYGMDIDYRIINVCKANAWMYVPWMIFRPSEVKGLNDVDIEDRPQQALVESVKEITPEVQKELLKQKQLTFW